MKKEQPEFLFLPFSPSDSESFFNLYYVSTQKSKHFLTEDTDHPVPTAATPQHDRAERGL